MRLRVGLLAGVVIASACRRGDETGVLITLAVDQEAFRPEYALVTLVGRGGPLDPERLPPSGSFPATGRVLGTIYVRFDPAISDERRILIVGMRGGVQVSVTEARVTPERGYRQELTVVLGAGLDGADAGVTADGDTDTLLPLLDARPVEHMESMTDAPHRPPDAPRAEVNPDRVPDGPSLDGPPRPPLDAQADTPDAPADQAPDLSATDVGSGA